MTILDLDQHAEPPAPAEPRRDRYGRYLITPASGGAPTAHTRATTWAKALDDQEGLINWSMRMTALGLAARHDLYAQVASIRGDDKQLRSLVDQAKEAGGASVKANLGTALHRFTWRTDLGERLAIPDPYAADIAAYQRALFDAGLTIEQALIERVAVVDRYTVAGTFDRILRQADGRLVIADIKTGSLDYAALAISVQLALYAHADTLYDYASDAHEAMPDVRRDVALVIHLPAGSGTCALHEVDIEAGWRYAELAGHVRAARAASKRRGCLIRPANLPAAAAARPAASLAKTAAPPDEAAALLANLYARLRALPSAAAADMRARWPADIPLLKTGGHTATQLARLADILTLVEAAHEVPFGEPDPRHVAAAERKRAGIAEAAARAEDWRRRGAQGEGDLDPDGAAEMIASVEALPADAQATIGGWAREGVAAKRGWSLRKVPSTRRYLIYRVAISLAVAYDGDRDIAAAVLDAATGTCHSYEQPIGAVLGSLSLAEATKALDVLTGLDSGATALAYDAVERPYLAATGERGIAA